MADTTFVSKSLPAIPTAWLQDLNDLFYKGTKALTVTTLTTTVKVVTPQVTTASGDLITDAFSGIVRPGFDNSRLFGTPSFRWNSVFTTIVDSGVASSLLLRTSNGQTGFEVGFNGTAANWIKVFPSPSGSNFVQTSATGSDTNILAFWDTKGTGSHNFRTDVPATNVVQLQILHTASATRNVTVTGSNGGNPTIGVTAGSLAITPSVLIAGNFLQLGSTSALTGALRVPYGASGNGGLAARLQDNSGDQQLIDVTTQNAVTNVVFVGASIGGPNNSNGVVIRARSGAGAPTTSDIPAGDWALWRDTTGATTKLYYNNAGAIQSVALA